MAIKIDTASTQQPEGFSPFWLHYQLPHNPFAWTDGSIEPYSALPDWDTNFDLIHHLLHNSNVMIIVESKDENNLPMLQAELIAQLDPERMHYYKISGDPQFTPNQLPKIFHHHFRCPLNETLTLELILENQLTELQYQPHFSTLMVDKAHTVSEHTLALLLALVAEQSENQMHFHVILFGDNSLSDKIKKISEQQDNAELVHLISYPSLTRSQVKKYLQNRLTAINASDFDLLRENDITRIHKNAANSLKQLNILASQIAQEKFEKQQKKRFAKQMRLSPTIWKAHKQTMIGGSILLIGIVIASYLSDKLEKKSPPPQTAINSVTQTIKYAAAAEIPTVPYQRSTVVSPVIAKAFIAKIPRNLPEYTRSELPGSLPPVKEGHYANRLDLVTNNAFITAVKKDQAAPVSRDYIKKNNPAQKTRPLVSLIISHANIPRIPKRHIKKPLSKPNKPVVITNLKPTVITNKKPNYFMDEKFLLSIPKTYYTIQLMAARNKINIKHYQKLKLPKKLYQYKTLRKGEPWYVVVYGTYASSDEAKAEIKKLPNQVSNFAPWTKVLQNIQDEIKHPPNE